MKTFGEGCAIIPQRLFIHRFLLGNITMQCRLSRGATFFLFSRVSRKKGKPFRIRIKQTIHISDWPIYVNREGRRGAGLTGVFCNDLYRSSWLISSKERPKLKM